METAQLNYEGLLEQNTEGYTGEWIILIDGQIVAHGKELHTILKQVKEKYPNKRPFLAKIPGKETMIF